MRPRPNHYEFFFNIASKNEMNNPEGRAIYACNRVANGAWWRPPFIHEPEAKSKLEKTKDSTAKRWLEHWENGGSLRALSRYHEEEKVRQKESMRMRREEWKKYKEGV